jgi:hypothetical protein
MVLTMCSRDWDNHWLLQSLGSCRSSGSEYEQSTAYSVSESIVCVALYQGAGSFREST